MPASPRRRKPLYGTFPVKAGGLPRADKKSRPIINQPEAEICAAPEELATENYWVPETSNLRLDRVLAQLRLYEHPLLNFSARAKGDAVEVIIQFKDPSIPVHTYYFDLHPRDLDHPQFEWTFQRQLFDCLHDYLIEMFIRTPQNRAERQQDGL
jgi:hypothetical protein